MSTLHLCHWQGSAHLTNHLPFIGDDDSLVIFGDFNSQFIESLPKLLACVNVSWYIVNNTPENSLNERQIDHNEWLQLIIKHNNSYAWK
jgi:hypothetical protein